MSSSKRILVGVLAGIAVGLFLGERAAPLDFFATAFVKLLQVTVLPYMTVSIVLNLGRLDYAQARTMGLKSGAVLLGFWAIGIGFAFLFPLAFPMAESARFFSTTIVEPRTPFDFIALYIPANPFFSLANNVVPAVVLFSVLIGIAVIGLDNKALLLDVLSSASNALSRATKLITRLMPYGLFAIGATTAGTLDVEQLGRLQVYLLTYAAVTALLCFWVLPGIVAALTPIPAREVLGRCRDALLTAFMAGDLFIVLPMLIEATKELIQQHGLDSEREARLPDVLVSASYNFPSTSKVMTISFVLFAGWFADAPIPLREYPSLAVAGLLAFFGSLNASVPFLLDAFRVPADTFQLFLATGVINSHLGALVSAVHTACLALLASFAVTGALRFRPARVLRYAAVTVTLAVAVFGGSRLLFETVLTPAYTQDDVLMSMRLPADSVVTTVFREAPPPPAPAASGGTLERIRERGVLRVGYLTDGLPFSFFNRRGELVGYDVDLAHRLAADLDVKLELVPVDRERLADALGEQGCDIVMAGVAETTERAERVGFSTSYLDETFAFVVPDHRRNEFADWESIRARPHLKVLAPDVAYYLDKLRARVPRADVETFADIEPLLAARTFDADAIALTAERGSTWTLLYPQFSVVVPKPGVARIPLAYPLAQSDERWHDFVDLWIDLKRKDGTLDELYDYWILGRNAEPRPPRWSIVGDVLHWVD